MMYGLKAPVHYQFFDHSYKFCVLSVFYIKGDACRSIRWFVNKHATRPMPDGRDIIDEYEKSNTAQADVVDEDHLVSLK